MREITFATRSERGARATNEDALGAGHSGSAWYAVLADGAGGHSHGAEASRLTVRRVEQEMLAAGYDFRPQRMTQALLHAHAEVQQGQAGRPERDRMLSTVVVLWIDGMHHRVMWSHVGDSRLYRLRHGRVDCLTSDDSVVQGMLEAGLITPQQARDHPYRSQLLAAIGMLEAIEPHTTESPTAIEDGDAFLLCSDGWWDALGVDFIARAFRDATSPQEWLAAMHKQIVAQARPRQDNYSAVGVWIGARASPPE